ncbi:MAG: lysophospholipid acyltransferase family protein [Flavobacteriaceae bacterium]
MQFLVYILAFPLLWLISMLPHPLFYGLSDIMYLLIYRVFGYRKKVVRNNLRLVFPEKSKKERRLIEKKFYRHFCDSLLEMIQGMSLTKSSIKRKYEVQNIEVMQRIEKTKSILVPCAHYANWEWNVSINNYVSSKGYAVYQRVNNRYFDRLIRNIRAKWNTELIPQWQTIKVVIRNHQNNVGAIYGMVSDQAPQAHRAQYWAPFMGITVPIFTGTEDMARKLDLAVVFLKVSKVGRGYYQATFIPITESGSKTSKHEITDTFLRLVEAQIREAPEYYLWTHKRWKHRDKVPEEFKGKSDKKQLGDA